MGRICWYAKVKVLVSQLCLTLWDPIDCIPLILSPWNFPGKNMGVGSHSPLQRILLTQGSNQVSALQADSLHLWPPGNPICWDIPFCKKCYTIFTGYFPFKVITKEWLNFQCCITPPWAYVIPNNFASYSPTCVFLLPQIWYPIDCSLYLLVCNNIVIPSFINGKQLEFSNFLNYNYVETAYKCKYIQSSFIRAHFCLIWNR